MTAFAQPNKNDLTRLLAESLLSGQEPPSPSDLMRYAKDAGVILGINDAKAMVKDAKAIVAAHGASISMPRGADSFYKSPTGEGVFSSIASPDDVQAVSPKQATARAASAARGGVGAGLYTKSPQQAAKEAATRKWLTEVAAPKAGAGTAAKAGAAAASAAATTAEIAGIGAKGATTAGTGLAEGLAARAAATASTGAKAGSLARLGAGVGRALPWVGAALTAAQIVDWLYSVTKGRQLASRAESFGLGMQAARGVEDDIELSGALGAENQRGRLIEGLRGASLDAELAGNQEDRNFMKLLSGAQSEIAGMSRVEPMSMDEVMALSQILGGR